MCGLATLGSFQKDTTVKQPPVGSEEGVQRVALSLSFLFFFYGLWIRAFLWVIFLVSSFCETIYE